MQWKERNGLERQVGIDQCRYTLAKDAEGFGAEQGGKMIAHFRGRGGSISRPDASQRASCRVRMQGAVQCRQLDHTRSDMAFMRHPISGHSSREMEMRWNVDRRIRTG